jgi:hypothetical protein
MTPLALRRADLPHFVIQALRLGLVEHEASGCWRWSGPHHPRSGTPIVRGLLAWLAVPRAAFAVVHGTCGPERLRATCGNVWCCAPGHHRPWHTYRPVRRPARRLSAEQITTILRLAKAGAGTMQIARAIGYGPTAISRVRHRKTYVRAIAALTRKKRSA